MGIRVAIVLVGVLAARAAIAGPYCGGRAGWSPSEAAVPAHAHLVFWQEDSSMLSTGRAYEVVDPKIVATIDGKRVAILVRPTRARDIVLYDVTISGARSGALVVEAGAANDRKTAHFTIDPAWHLAAPSATTTRYRQQSDRMITIMKGLAIAVAQAIAFRVRWRRDAHDTWRTVVLPAVDRGDGTTAALLGETNCQSPDVPLAMLEHGIELDVTATFPDGSAHHVAGLDGAVVLPPTAAP